MVTVCCTYFPPLTLAHLQAALYSVRQQCLSRVQCVLVMANNTPDPPQALDALITDLAFPIPVHLLMSHHGDPAKTHAWSTNQAIYAATTPWILMTRADYLLDLTLIARFLDVVDQHPDSWNGFVTGHVYHLRHADLAACDEQTQWRQHGARVLRALRGSEGDYTCIDAGVWLARRDACLRVGGLDEALTVWGHAQTLFQYRLHQSGTECVRLPDVLFVHPKHAGVRPLALAHQQLRDRGVQLPDLWARYHGGSPYD